MIAEARQLERSEIIKNRPKLIEVSRRKPKNFLMHLLVIFPRVDVTRNKCRVNRDPPDGVSMFFKQRAQTFLKINVQQFIAINDIDQNRMAAASFEFRLKDFSIALSPFAN